MTPVKGSHVFDKWIIESFKDRELASPSGWFHYEICCVNRETGDRAGFEMKSTRGLMKDEILRESEIYIKGRGPK